MPAVQEAVREPGVEVRIGEARQQAVAEPVTDGGVEFRLTLVAEWHADVLDGYCRSRAALEMVVLVKKLPMLLMAA